MFNPMNWLSSIINFLIDVVYLIVQGLVFLLPTSPFEFNSVNWGDWGKLIGLFIPVSKMFLHFSAILTATLLYYAIRQLLRIIKMVQ